MNESPHIGITINDPSTPVARRYAAAIEAAAGVPVWITPAVLRASGDPRAILQTCDALLLGGGRDIDPQMYGERLQPGIGVDVDANRYEVEVPLARTALEEDVPVLGICGGMQCMNVASGGSLHQDLSLLGIDPSTHRVTGTMVYHVVRVTPGSRLGQLVDAEDLRVNSSHHQAVKRPGTGAIVTASAADGVIETIEFPARRFAVGVEWHPERMPDDEPQRRLFRAFVTAARQARSSSRV